MEELENALKKASQNASGGIIERGAEQMVIRSQGLFRRLDDIAAVPVATREGTPVLVRDVAAVSDGWAPRQGVISRDDQFDTVEGIVLMRRGENPSVVLAARASGRRRAQRATFFPTASSSIPFYDRTDLVNTTLHTVGHNLVEGAALVVLVLFVFLLDLRAALIVGTIIPLSLLSRLHLSAACAA